MNDRQPTPAQRYRDAVWEATAEHLTTTELAVALAYADHCRGGADTAWVAYRRLMQRAKIRSMSTVTRVLGDLVDKGWLVLVGPSKRHRQSATYRLTVPTAPTISADPANRTDGRNISTQASEAAPMVDGTAPIIEQTAPINGADRTDHGHPPSESHPQGDSLPAYAGAAPAGAPAPPGNGRSAAAEEALAQLRAKLPPGRITQPGRHKRSDPWTVDLDRYTGPIPVPEDQEQRTSP